MPKNQRRMVKGSLVRHDCGVPNGAWLGSGAWGSWGHVELLVQYMVMVDELNRSASRSV